MFLGRRGFLAWTFVAVVVVSCVNVENTAAQLPPDVVDTQPAGDVPLTPQESLQKFTVPDGFRVTLFAGEPDVHQPIDMTFDDRGRLWVVECYSYPDWQSEHRDRILIFTDADNDGRFDTRTVFAENLRNVTGIALGFGGVWACSTPELIFIPDVDADDKPDGPPIVKLDGWNDGSDEVEHNVFNGIVWGPNGWMYGGHGILADSFVGKPGAPDDERQRLNCGIWRFHPVHETFEVVAHGTTNPWGIDFDDRGQGFFTNSVIGHLWHLIPSARYRRMYGTHFNPHTYTLIDQCADHLHWGGGVWMDSRGGVGVHSKAGGGHAHVGAMIYRGGRWPQQYHGSLFTCNLHGNRINRDVLSRRGSGYVATHADDFLLGNDPWFRGIDLLYGPDGNVLVSDWTDLGECHDSDGTHRSSGRIYKIVYEADADEATFDGTFDLAVFSNIELLDLAMHRNAWYWNHARRILQERAARGDEMQSVIASARERFASAAQSDSALRLKMLSAWTLSGGRNVSFVTELLNHSDEYVQCWAVRQLVDLKKIDTLAELNVDERTSPALRLELAASLQQLPLSKRWDLARGLLHTHGDVDDANVLSMIWYGIEPLADVDQVRFASLIDVANSNQRLSVLRQSIARRIVADDPVDVARIDLLLNVARPLDAAAKLDVLRGIELAVQAERSVGLPTSWRTFRRTLERVGDVRLSRDLQQTSDSLAVKFRDPEAIARIQYLAMDVRADVGERREAIEALVGNRVDGVLDLLTLLLNERDVRLDAIRSMSQFNAVAVSRELLQRFSTFNAQEQSAAISTLASSRTHAIALLQAVARGDVSSATIKPAQAAEIAQLGDVELQRELREHWGDLRSTSRENRQKIANWKATLTDDVLAVADLQNGAVVYAQNCGKCHKLFGKGGDVGPDLTGSDRRNLDYILQNVVTPSAAVGTEFRLHSVLLNDGRVVSGALREQTSATVVVQTSEMRVTIPRREIERIEPTELSLMPEGQFDAIPSDHVRDVIAYLRLATE